MSLVHDLFFHGWAAAGAVPKMDKKDHPPSPALLKNRNRPVECFLLPQVLEMKRLLLLSFDVIKFAFDVIKFAFDVKLGKEELRNCGSGAYIQMCGLYWNTSPHAMTRPLRPSK
ncbi:hypothetical protein [Pseudomonas sp. KU43P]|uniref:hypothetical protein n=1 Tax=Pseudomonas sp. KU43P TaxID=2487887 RepID=UPI0029558F2A|nr:hypothetical protein [Pseudomonas sp. KU43P]